MKKKITTTFCLLFVTISIYSQKLISESYTAFYQNVKLDKGNYKKVRVSGFVKVESKKKSTYSSFFVQQIDANDKSLGLIGGRGENKVTNKEKLGKVHKIEVDFNPKTRMISFGSILVGFGKFYFDDFRLEVLNDNDEWESLIVKNSSFENEIKNNNIRVWKEGIYKNELRSKFYSFRNTVFKGSKALEVEGVIPEVNLHPDREVISKKLNEKKESVLIKGINVVNVNTGEISKKDVLIKNQKIEKIANNIKVDSNFIVVKAENKWLIPGLIDSHIHLFQSGGLYTRPDALDLTKFKAYEEERKWLKRYAADFLKRYLRCGITTLIDVGGPLYNFKIKEKYSDITEYPNLLMAGPLISTYQPSAFNIEDAPIIKANSTEEAINLVREQVPYKPDFIKIWYINRVKEKEKNYEIVSAAINEAHKNNLKVAVHATELEIAKKAIRAGADFLVHSVEDDELDEELIRMIKEKNIAYIPTLQVSKNYLKVYGKKMKPTKEDFNISNPTALGSLYDSNRIEIKPFFEKYIKRAKNREVVSKEEEELMAKNLKKAIENDFIVATGTDAGNIGTLHATSYFDELILMKNAGLTNLDILKASTINGAKILGKEKILGSIEEGKMADLVILNANPLKELNALKKIDKVIKGGSVFLVDEIIKDTPEQLVQRQVNGYNAGDIDAFLKPYSEDFEIFNFPNDFSSKGKEKNRDTYIKLFKKYPNLHCEIVNRIVLGNKVVDHERITGISEIPSEVIAIYEIEKGKISKVTFVRK